MSFGMLVNGAILDVNDTSDTIGPFDLSAGGDFTNLLSLSWEQDGVALSSFVLELKVTFDGGVTTHSLSDVDASLSDATLAHNSAINGEVSVPSAPQGVIEVTTAEGSAAKVRVFVFGRSTGPFDVASLPSDVARLSIAQVFTAAHRFENGNLVVGSSSGQVAYSSEATASRTRTVKDASGEEMVLTDLIPVAGELVQRNSGNTGYESAPLSDILMPACFTESGSTNIPGGGGVQIGLDTATISHSNYSIASSVITVSEAGTYEVSYSVPINEDSTSGATRGRVFGWVERNPGGTGSFSAITQSRSQTYVQEASGGGGISAAFHVELTADDDLQLMVDEQNAIDISTESGETQLSIKRVG